MSRLQFNLPTQATERFITIQLVVRADVIHAIPECTQHLFQTYFKQVVFGSIVYRIVYKRLNRSIVYKRLNRLQKKLKIL